MRACLLLLVLVACATAETFNIDDAIHARYGDVVPPSEYFTTQESTVSTANGNITGTVYRTARAFYAIPYAQPPTGNLRFAPPEPSTAFGSMQATKYGPGCPQDCALPPFTCTYAGTSEDCLTLDVYTPRGATPQSNLPVLFFIHGGNFIQGGTGTILYNADFIANNSQVVVVNIQYRLGALGFFYNGNVTGNFAILDQNMALQWVKANIGAFGGNSNSITIWGQSAGGVSVMTHLISPTSQGVIRGAAMDSNPITLNLNSKTEATKISSRFANLLGCQPADLACLRSQDPNDIVSAQEAAIKIYPLAPLNAFMPWLPMVDGDLIPMQPMDAISSGQYNHVPFITGTVNDEGLMFIDSAFTSPVSYEQFLALIGVIFGPVAPQVLKQYPVPASEMNDTRPVISQLGTDYIFLCPVRHVVREMSTAVPVFYYHFDHVFSFDPWGPDYTECADAVCHGSELPYIFNSAQIGHRFTGYVFTPEEDTLAQTISTFWGNFATSGNPNNPKSQGLNWPQYQQTSDEDMKFATPSGVETGYSASICDFWDTIGYTWGN